MAHFVGWAYSPTICASTQSGNNRRVLGAAIECGECVYKVEQTFLSVRIRECWAFLPSRADSNGSGGQECPPLAIRNRQECLFHHQFNDPNTPFASLKHYTR